MSRILDVYLYNVKVGKLMQSSAGALSFSYDNQYVLDEGPAVSFSLPLRGEVYRGDAVRAFFSGFLPDDLNRTRLAKYLGVSDKNPFALLEVIGGECAGALSLFPADYEPPLESLANIALLDSKKLKEILGRIKTRPMLAGEDGVRLSLAGAQDKLAVSVSPEGDILLVGGSQPTSHILKPLISTIQDSVHNELFCMRLAKAVGIETPDVSIGWAGEMPYFLIERYDRFKDDGGQLQRLHQEDFCQAMGVMPELKYEKEGGPGISQCQKLIQEVSMRPAVDQLDFIKRVMFNFFIGNADAHGKNFSLLYKGKRPVLAPAYDILCTSIYENLASKMAMKIGGHYEEKNICLRHWYTLVPDTAVAHKGVEKSLSRLAHSMLIESEKLVKSLAEEGINSVSFGKIIEVIQMRSKYFV